MKARLFPLIGVIAASLAMSLALASCGVRTGLETPPPMWGKARKNYLAEQERLKVEAAARAPSTAPPTEQLSPPRPNTPIGRSPISPIPAEPPSTQPPG